MNFHAAKAYILDRLEQELSTELTYHSLQHTRDVLRVTIQLCKLENISPYETMLLKTAALYHDSGFLISNQNHEAIGCDIVRKTLSKYQYPNESIERICSMIMATKIPQSPHNRLEAIICDADLDYLGRSDFYYIGNKLFDELKAFNILHNEMEWNQLQIKFLEKHHFFTVSSQSLREPTKQKYLAEIRQWVDNHQTEHITS